MRRGVAGFVAAAIAVVVIAGSAIGAVQPSGPLFRISTTGTDGDLSRDPFTPAVAYNPAANNYLVVWESDHLADGQFEVHGQLVSATGAEIGADFRISNTTDVATGRDGDNPSVAYNSDDNEYLVTFTADGLPAVTDDQFEIYGQRVSAAGVPDAQGDFRISNASDVDAFRDAVGRPTLSYDATLNQYLVVWEGDQVVAEDEQFEIYGQLVNANGTEAGTDFRISEMNTDNLRDAEEPKIAFNPTANQYLVAWGGDGLPGSTDEQYEIFGQRVSAAGVPDAQGDFRISNVTDVDAMRDVCETSFDACSPGIAYNSTADEYLVAWNGDPLADETFEIYGQRVSAAGVPNAQGDFRISNVSDVGASRDAVIPSATYNPIANQYLVVWEADAGTFDQQKDGFAQAVSPAGADVGAEFPVWGFGSDANAFTGIQEIGAAHNSVADGYLVVGEGGGGLPSNEREVFGRLLADPAVTQPQPPPGGSTPPATTKCKKKKKKKGKKGAVAAKKKKKGCKKKKKKK